jgi:AcrR family transcriptional regulator
MEERTTRIEVVKGRRAASAAATRAAVVTAASALFVERGYHATSIADLAGRAGVAPQTIYNAVGTKREVLSAVLDAAAAGARGPTPVPVFLQAAAENETDPRRILDQLVEFWTGAMARTAPIFNVIRQAAALDAEVAELERARGAQRRRNYETAATLLAERGGLRPGLDVASAAALIFAIGHPETYRSLVLDGGWPVERWAAWVGDALAAALLPPAP